ncbi:Rap1a/Tai family immunity protein [Xanthomonas graminis]|jgi:hypothetical protein|uniref:Rap1a immunity protein domain-containing protein n=1 Tax=Xanthomonas graminis pv. graminis TaxID=134874 RepID=A0A1M4IM05_9XANT|nr:Rap1a/Tai family immunity protein [Xanthomonas translucens]EKU24021.1 hypothetical protein XTG29_03171 [Xanthomonas translucens pv. graminis ART-Xtg29]OAX59447.1 hypothetical protein A6R72_16770 [Xanthomonas translucens pv. graminis]UKE55222.1 hypothetical protein KFS84_05210 [Xanthomonas translucens pv. graminis]WIH09579.1 hypothetical protein KM579_05695 [Xanthomonas translucens pv. graminis]WIH12906.1 hypothetical protein KM563_03680 [Xanthomonas translucens pv. graminis]
MSLRIPFLFVLCLAACGATPVLAAPVQTSNADVHQLSAAHLLQLLKGDPEAVAGLQPQLAERRRQQASEAAKFYIAGVADGAEGVQWCAGGGVLRHELADRVYTALSALPPAQLQQRASIAVSQALRASFPCSR